MTPGELAQNLEVKSHEFSVQTDLLIEILEKKPGIWNEMRRDFKSDTSCERAWSATENGLKEMRFKLKMKALEKTMSAIRTQLRIMESEARNLF